MTGDNVDDKVEVTAEDHIASLNGIILRADAAILAAIEAVAEVVSAGTDTVRGLDAFVPATVHAFSNATMTQQELVGALERWAAFHAEMHDLLAKLGKSAPKPRGGGGGGKDD